MKIDPFTPIVNLPQFTLVIVVHVSNCKLA